MIVVAGGIQCLGDAQELDEVVAAVVAAAAGQAGGGFFEELVEAAAFGDGAGDVGEFADAVEQGGVAVVRQLAADDGGVERDGFLGAQQEDLAGVEFEFDAAVFGGDDDFVLVYEVADFEWALGAVLGAGEGLTLDHCDFTDDVACCSHVDAPCGIRTGAMVPSRAQENNCTEVQVAGWGCCRSEGRPTEAGRRPTQTDFGGCR